MMWSLHTLLQQSPLHDQKDFLKGKKSFSLLDMSTVYSLIFKIVKKCFLFFLVRWWTDIGLANAKNKLWNECHVSYMQIGMQNLWMNLSSCLLAKNQGMHSKQYDHNCLTLFVKIRSVLYKGPKEEKEGVLNHTSLIQVNDLFLSMNYQWTDFKCSP